MRPCTSLGDTGNIPNWISNKFYQRHFDFGVGVFWIGKNFFANATQFSDNWKRRQNLVKNGQNRQKWPFLANLAYFSKIRNCHTERYTHLFSEIFEPACFSRQVLSNTCLCSIFWSVEGTFLKNRFLSQKSKVVPFDQMANFDQNLQFWPTYGSQRKKWVNYIDSKWADKPD